MGNKKAGGYSQFQLILENERGQYLDGTRGQIGACWEDLHSPIMIGPPERPRVRFRVGCRTGNGRLCANLHYGFSGLCHHPNGDVTEANVTWTTPGETVPYCAGPRRDLLLYGYGITFNVDSVLARVGPLDDICVDQYTFVVPWCRNCSFGEYTLDGDIVMEFGKEDLKWPHFCTTNNQGGIVTVARRLRYCDSVDVYGATLGAIDGGRIAKWNHQRKLMASMDLDLGIQSLANGPNSIVFVHPISSIAVSLLGCTMNPIQLSFKFPRISTASCTRTLVEATFVVVLDKSSTIFAEIMFWLCDLLIFLFRSCLRSRTMFFINLVQISNCWNRGGFRT